MTDEYFEAHTLTELRRGFWYVLKGNHPPFSGLPRGVEVRITSYRRGKGWLDVTMTHPCPHCGRPFRGRVHYSILSRRRPK